jgi:hypothetical protein
VLFFTADLFMFSPNKLRRKTTMTISFFRLILNTYIRQMLK